MTGIEETRNGLDQLSGQVEQYRQNIVDLTNEDLVSIAERTQQAAQLATQLGSLLEGIKTDARTYINTLRQFDDLSIDSQNLVGTAQELAANGPAVLAEVPGRITRIGSVTVGNAVIQLERATQPLAKHILSARQATTAMERLEVAFSTHRVQLREEVMRQTDTIKLDIQEGKAAL